MKHLTSDCSILFSLAYSAKPSYCCVSAKDGRGVSERASDAERAAVARSVDAADANPGL